MKYFKRIYLEKKKDMAELDVKNQESYLDELFERQMNKVLKARNKLHCIELELRKL